MAFETTHDLDYFMRLVLKGRKADGSRGEHAALRLACRVADDLPKLDGRAQRGWMEFVELCRRNPSAGEDLLDRAQ